jgi:hypothetical protein
MVSLRVDTTSPPAWARRFTVQYTPTVITLDGDGTEHHRTVGFLPPEEFIPSLMLGMAKTHMDAQRQAQARAMLEWLLLAYPKSQAASTANQLLRKT